MNTEKWFIPKLLLLMTLSLTVLSACSNKAESSNEVLAKAKEVLVTVESANVDVAVSVLGSSGSDDIEFTGALDISFDKRDKLNRMTNARLTLSGMMKAGGRVLDGDIDFSIIAMGSDYYIKLDKLASSDASLASVQPFIELYKNKWLRISEDFIPENIRSIQEQSEETTLKQEQLKALFLDIELFNVSKEYGIESLDGDKVYRYGLAANRDNVKDYIIKASVIEGRELTEAEVEEAVKVLDYISDIELFIDTDDYYISKAIFTFNGAALDDPTNLEVKVTIIADDFNSSVDIEAPEGAENFNPLNLMMGLGGLPTGEDLPVDGIEVTPAEDSAEVLEAS